MLCEWSHWYRLQDRTLPKDKGSTRLMTNGGHLICLETTIGVIGYICQNPGTTVKFL